MLVVAVGAVGVEGAAHEVAGLGYGQLDGKIGLVGRDSYAAGVVASFLCFL